MIQHNKILSKVFHQAALILYLLFSDGQFMQQSFMFPQLENYSLKILGYSVRDAFLTLLQRQKNRQLQLAYDLDFFLFLHLLKAH